MKDQYRAVVIGGGVVGCSVLYHLAKAGWKDVLLIERSELTSGSSWHAAGGFHTLNGDPNVAKLQAYTIGLYDELEEISGQSCGLHLVGGFMMADSPERMDFLRTLHAKGRYLGMETELVTPAEAKAMFPIMDDSNFVGGLWDPVEGHLDPSGTTHAYAKAARTLGAEIELRNRVTELTQDSDGMWNVVTEKGTVKAEHVVNAGGLWAREVGRMVGLELPLLAMEHMYLLTEDCRKWSNTIRKVVESWFTSSTSRVKSIPVRNAMVYCLAPMKRPVSLGRQSIRHGTLATNCFSQTSTGSRHLWKLASSISLRWKMLAFARSSMAHSPSHPMAIHWLVRWMVSPISGVPVQLWLGLARVAALVWRCPTGWYMVTLGMIFLEWM